ncbi:ladderlectin-like [Saccostrea cucullata]|uniref:ladderlectin-like n=1 Tax=Saccostrea cuccullata TaxID=36930 RepID=UPI002ED6AD00
MLPKNETVYMLETQQKVSRVQYGLLCLLHDKYCAGMLYNNATENCKILKSRLNEQSVDRSQIEIGWELFVHTNGCESGWILYDGHAFLHRYPNHYELDERRSKLHCKNLGANMVTIDTEEENQWMMDVFVPPWNSTACSEIWRCCNTWIGLSDIDQECLFTWTQQRSTMYWKWNTGDPNNGGGNQDCAALCQNGYWIDRN